MAYCPEKLHDPIRILVVAGENLRQELVRLLIGEDGLRVVCQAERFQQVLEHGENLQPDVVLLDLDSLAAEARQAVTQVRHRFADSKLIVITTSGQDDVVVEAFKQGADGHLARDTAELASIGRVIRAVKQGETILSPHIAGRIMDEMQLIKQSRQKNR